MLINVDPALADDVAAFSDRLTRWLGADGATLCAAHPSGATMTESVTADRTVLRALYESGWSRYGWPGAVGGWGGNELHRAAMYDALSRAGVEIPEAFVILETLGPVLTRYAPDLAGRHLGAYLSGDQLWAQGFSEPDAGSDLGALRTAATQNQDGTWTVTGEKVWSTLGQFADHALVLARTAPKGVRVHEAMTMFWVDLRADGAAVRAIRAANGRDEFAEMHFNGVQVAQTELVGAVGDGWNVAMYLLQYERGMYAWLRQSILHRRVGELARDAGDGADTALGEAFLAVAALRSRTRATVRDLSEAKPLGPEVSVDKLLLSQAEHAVFNCAERILGPEFAFGATDSERLGRLEKWRQEWFYSRATSIFGGAAEIQRDTIAKHVLKLDTTRR